MSEQAAAPAADPVEILPPGEVWAMITLQLAIFIAVGVGLWHLSGRLLSDFVTIDLRGALLGVAVGLALIGVFAALWRLFPDVGERLIRKQAPTYLAFGRPSPLLIVFVSIAAGAGEEALFRGGMQTLLGDHVAPWAAIAVSSAVFAAVHFAAPVVMVLIFLIGSLLGVVYDWSGSLFAVMLAHTLYDIWAVRYLFREFDRLGLYENTVNA